MTENTVRKNYTHTRNEFTQTTHMSVVSDVWYEGHYRALDRSYWLNLETCNRRSV